MVFRPTFAIKLLGAAFFVIGAVLAISFSTRVIDSLTALVSGSAFLLAALYIALRNLKPEGFDNNRRIFQRGYSIQKDTRRLRGGKTLPFAEIHAVQLLTKAGAMKVGSDIYMADEYFPAYELNLVTQEADRVFLMTYLDKATALQDAQIISDFTGVPLWSVLPQ